MALGRAWTTTTATLILELAAASCDEVTPAAPTVTEAVCTDGGLSSPSLVFANTDGVTYTVDPAEPYVSGQSVIVTAILDAAGVAWGDAVPAGWTAVDDQTATLSVTFDDVSCIAVSPADPTPSPPGPSTEGIVELPVTPGITYTVDTVDTGFFSVVRAVIPNGYRVGTTSRPMDPGRCDNGGVFAGLTHTDSRCAGAYRPSDARTAVPPRRPAC